MPRYKRNTVKGRQRGRKWGEAKKTACMCDLLICDNLSDVAKKHGVPESTLRTWKKEAEKLDESGQRSLWAQAREENIRQIASKAAEGARLSTEMMIRRLQSGDRNMRRVEEIDNILLDGELDPDEHAPKELQAEREKRAKNVPSDFAMSNMLRALSEVSAKAAGEQRTENSVPESYEKYLAEVSGDEW